MASYIQKKQQKIAVVRVLWPRDELVSQAGHVAQNMRIKKESQTKRRNFITANPHRNKTKANKKQRKKQQKVYEFFVQAREKCKNKNELE